MRKFLGNGIIFLFLSGFLYLTGYFVLANIKLSGQPLINWFDENLGTLGTLHRAAIEYEKDKPFDIAVFGSSHAYRGYDPRIFQQKMGKKIFNFGSSAQSLPNSYHYIKNESQKGDYELVILDLLVSIFENKALESSIMLVRNVPDDKLARDIFLDEKDIRLLNIYLARYLILNDTNYYRNPDYVSHGFVSKTNTMTPPEEVSEYKPFDPTPRSIERFKQLLTFCHSNDIPLVLVNQPRPKETNPQKNNEFSELIHQLNEPYGFPFFDYSMDHELNTENNFYDLGHMNQTGVEYFNDRLCNDLIELLELRNEH